MSADWFRFERDTVLRAGAGAGKTQALVGLYLHLIGGATARRQRLAPGAIMAISFTEKAASELSARIRARLVRLARGDLSGEAELAQTAAALDIELPDGDEWERALSLLGAAPVGTFHRLGGALLRRHSVSAGIDPAFRQLDEAQAAALLEACAERAVLTALDRGDAAVRALIVELGFGPTPFSSGAVGKLVELYRQRSEQGLDATGLADNYQPDALAAGFRRAATGLVTAARQLSSLPGLAPTWQALQRPLAGDAAAWLQTHGAASSEEACQRALRGAGELVAPALGATARGTGCREAKADLQAALDYLAAQVRGFAAAPLAFALARLLADTSHRYRVDKQRIGALDFSDLIVRARDLLRDHPSVRAIEQRRCEVLLVDEFQDTNAVQAELVALLAGDDDGAAEQAGPARLLLVGDRKQSIYEFRGADVSVFVGAEEAIARRGGARGVLDRSFRSRPALVTFANLLFARTFGAASGGDPFDILWDPDTDPLEPARPLDEGPAGELIVLAADRAAALDAEARRLLEARALAARLSQLHAAGQRDMALLLRGFTQVEVYLEALRRAGVPHYVVNGRGFFQAQEVRDLAAALRLLDDPDDRLALVTLLRSPLVLVSDETLLRLEVAGQLNLEALLASGAEAVVPVGEDARAVAERTRLGRIRRLLGDLRPRADRLGPHALLRALCDGTDYEATLAGGYQGEQRAANLAALLEKARAIEEAGGDLRSFTRALAELSQPDRLDPEAQAPIATERSDVVRVMTVHQAKGLEFAVVALAGCGTVDPQDRGPVYYDSQGGLGIKLRGDAGLEHTGCSQQVVELRRRKAKAESRRLFYVAVTRARDRLILCGERGSRSGFSWRQLIDDARRADAGVAALLPEVPAEKLAVVPAAPVGPLPAGQRAAADELVARATRPLPVPPPAAISIAVTQLADFAACPRRHKLLHIVGLAEHLGPSRDRNLDATDGDLDPLTRGTLAHHLLEHADPARGTADLDGLLAAAGYDPQAAAVAEVRGHVARFMATAFYRSLSASASLEVHRELPFVLSEPGDHGAPLRLRGQIDLLCVDREAGAITIVDYKHSRAGTGADYRFQLDAYALAARRILPDVPFVRAGLAFLREADPSPTMVDHDAARCADFAADLGRLGAALWSARATDQFLGQPEPVCRDLGCGFLRRCHRGSV